MNDDSMNGAYFLEQLSILLALLPGAKSPFDSRPDIRLSELRGQSWNDRYQPASLDADNGAFHRSAYVDPMHFVCATDADTLATYAFSSIWPEHVPL